MSTEMNNIDEIRITEAASQALERAIMDDYGRGFDLGFPSSFDVTRQKVVVKRDKFDLLMEELPDGLRLVEVLFTVTVNVALWAPGNEIDVAHSLLDSSCIEDFNDRIHFIGDRVIQAIVSVACDKKSFKVIDTKVVPIFSGA